MGNGSEHRGPLDLGSHGTPMDPPIRQTTTSAIGGQCAQFFHNVFASKQLCVHCFPITRDEASDNPLVVPHSNTMTLEVNHSTTHRNILSQTQHASPLMACTVPRTRARCRGPRVQLRQNWSSQCVGVRPVVILCFPSHFRVYWSMSECSPLAVP